jgi:NitT/TauT family transport system substrate-binding protein
MRDSTLLRCAARVLAVAMLSAAPALAQDKVTYNMSWLPQGSSIGPIVAQEQGYYKEAGLEVNIVRGYGGNRTANELDQGQFEFGYVDPISLVLNRSNGGKIRLVGAANTRWPAGICYVASKLQVKNLDSIKGLTMGGGSASPVQNVVPAWLEMNSKPKDFIRLLRMDPAVVDASLIEGRIDLAECWRASNRATIRKQAAAASVPVAWIEYSDYGLDAYGPGFATTEDIISKRPDMVRKFLKATYRGYAFAKANPDKAVDIIVKTFPTVDRGVALEQIRDINDLIVDSGAPDKRLGYLRADRMRATVGFVDKAYGLNGRIKPEDIYTNDLLN